MDSFSSMLEAFEALNAKKRTDPESLNQEEKKAWTDLRKDVERVLFQEEPDPRSDTREYLRVPMALSVSYWTSNELKDRYIQVMGEGGLFVSTVDPLPKGSQLDLEIALAEKGISFSVKGEVVNINESEDPAKRGMGIKFIELSYVQMHKIYSLVDDTLRQRLLERRRFARVQTKLQIQFVYADGFFELKTEDLSLGGLFIATENQVPVGEKIRLVLHIPGGQPSVKALCEVVRVVDASPGQLAGLGVRFLQLEEKDLHAIRQYLAQLVVDTYHPDEKERRRYPRVERLVKLRFAALDSIGVTLARDVSAAGVFVQTHEAPPLDSEIQISLVHPVSLQELSLVGRVVRVVPAEGNQVPGVGVSFEELSEEKRVQLMAFLREFVLIDGQEIAEASATETDELAPKG